jgi:hypothetical protein
MALQGPHQVAWKSTTTGPVAEVTLSAYSATLKKC